MTKPDPLCKDAEYSRDRFPVDTSKPRLYQAYAQGATDATLGIKENPYAQTSGLWDAYELGWNERKELSP